MASGSRGWVYFVRCGVNGLIKIGICEQHPDVRMAGLEAMSPLPLDLERLGVLAGYKDVERKLHGRFAHLRHHGEWFNPGGELMEFIRAEAMPWPGRGSVAVADPLDPARVEEGNRRMLDELVNWAWGCVVRDGHETKAFSFRIVLGMDNARRRHLGLPEFIPDAESLVAMES